jgi:hypothetical protein
MEIASGFKPLWRHSGLTTAPKGASILVEVRAAEQSAEKLAL